MNHNDPTEPDETTRADASPRQAVDPQDELLVAYLDGELSDAETENIETRLASDADLRQRLHNLQATWDMLDELPRAEPDRAFLKSTIEMVVTSAHRKKVKWHRWPLRIGMLLAAFAMAGLLGYGILRSVQTRPYRQFVADLDFLEHVEVYDQIQDVTFLQALQQSRVLEDFDTGESAAATSSSSSSSSSRSSSGVAQVTNEQRLQSMDAGDIIRLKQKHRAFQLYPSESQRMLRRMHQQVLNSPDRDQLLATSRTYAAWLNTIADDKKYEIVVTPAELRVDKVIELREAQLREYFGRRGATGLRPQDIDGLKKWWLEFIDRKSDAVLARLRERLPRRADQMVRFSAKQRFSILLGVDWSGTFQLIDPADVDSLKSILSDSAVEVLTACSLADQRVLLERWLQSASAAITQVDDQDLWDFYDSLTEEEKMKLDGLSRPAFKKDLIQKFREQETEPSEDNAIWFQLLAGPKSENEGGNTNSQDGPRD